jgi:UDP-N-acetylmuramyl tripeptide synthase
MDFHTTTTIAAAKLARHTARLRRHGGSALPGLVAETLAPDFLRKTLGHLPDGIVIVTGTNGKTTTTKIIADLLTSLGKHVLTNKSGSNFTRGIAATIVQEAKLGKSLAHDVAVIELDEAYAKKFVQRVTPRYVVALNVIRDQLDRFGEVDTTARLLEPVLRSANGACVINGDDPRLLAIGEQLAVPVSYYTVDPQLRQHFPTDEELLAISDGSQPAAFAPTQSTITLKHFEGRRVTYEIDKKSYTIELNLAGQYNYQNAAAAIALVRLILPAIPIEEILQKLTSVTPAFGRGETLIVGGQPLEIVLVKNPAGFRQSLRSFTSPAATMIAINDNAADGRDVSWLWDVTFETLQKEGVAMVSGIRAYDMALRLQYDEVPFNAIDTEVVSALKKLVRENPDKPKRIFCTYTAMLPLHAAVSALAGKRRIL